MGQIVVFFLFFFLRLTSLQHSQAEDITTFVYAGCSQAKYEPGSPYQANVNDLLSSLGSAAGHSSYSNLSSGDGSPSAAAVYGLFQCRGDLSSGNCQSCVESAGTRLSSLCIPSLGGAIQLQGCYIRFAKDPFAGEVDKSIAFQRCGPAANGDISGGKESVLEGLSSGGAAGSYRVASTGGVQGIAQCLGDLGPSQCTDCLTAAADAARVNCGASSSAALYLAKCYVRYWSSGDGGVPSAEGYHPGSSHIDRTSRIVAIVAGVMAVVVLLYVFVVSLKKPSEDESDDESICHHHDHVKH